MSRSDLVDLTLHIHAETDLEFLASNNGDIKNAHRLPRSQVEIERLKPSGSNEAIVTMPLWLATEKRLV